MIFMATNRLANESGFTNERNPAGNTWWSTPGAPFSEPGYWKRLGNQEAVEQIEAEGKPVVLLIHGFNESWQGDMKLTELVSEGLGDDYTIVPFSWDSLGSVFAYLQDRERAARSAGDLMAALIDLTAVYRPRVIAHSMGNFLLQEALKLVTGATAAYMDRLVMVAADVPFDALATSNIAQLTERGTVMYSSRDGALLGSAALHVGERLGEGGPGKPPYCPANFVGVNCRSKMPWYVLPIDVHGYYFKSKDCMEAMREALL